MLENKIPENIHFGGSGSKIKNSIVCLHSKKFASEINANKNISVVITTKNLAKHLIDDKQIIIDDDPVSLFYSKYIEYYNKREKVASEISDKAIISDKAVISPYGVVIGDDVVIEAGAVIKEGVVIKDRSHIGSCSVIGGDGFAIKYIYGKSKNIPHSGRVIIEKDVHISYNTCIDKGLFERDTVIGNGTKIDNLCHIAHGVRIGKNCMIVACSMIAGSCELKDNVYIGPNSNISNLVTIHDNATVSIGSMVTRDVAAGQTVTGYFAQEHKLFLRKYLEIFNL